MNFDCDEATLWDSNIQRRILVRAALTLCSFTFTEDDVDEITDQLRWRFGFGPGSDEEVVSKITPEFLAGHFDRKRDERNREAFKDELAARVWETVKGMTWFTDTQKVIPEDLAARVAQKQKDEADKIAKLREGLSS